MSEEDEEDMQSLPDFDDQEVLQSPWAQRQRRASVVNVEEASGVEVPTFLRSACTLFLHSRP